MFGTGWIKSVVFRPVYLITLIRENQEALFSPRTQMCSQLSSGAVVITKEEPAPGTGGCNGITFMQRILVSLLIPLKIVEPMWRSSSCLYG